MEIEVITGPTASGKSALALESAHRDPSIEIVNADASLLYRGFDIGTAKPTPSERASTPHHIIDILGPSETFSAAEYQELARQVIRDVISREKTPLVVGGTGFYIDALFEGLSVTEANDDDLRAARERFDREFEAQGFDAMLAALEAVDIVLHAQIIRERNPRRLQRAWEFYYATGRPLGEARAQRPEPFEHRPRFTVLLPEREELVKRIERRVDEMLAAGWLDEVRHLLSTGVTEEMPAMKSIGYRTLAEVLRGAKSLEDAREEIIVLTRQYAKRQVTWMKRYVR